MPKNYDASKKRCFSMTAFTGKVFFKMHRYL